MGDEVDETKIPPELEDFPSYVHRALDIFNKLPDIYTSTQNALLFTGKDLSSLETLYRIYEVEDNEEKRLILDVITLLDTRARKQSLKEAERAAKKAKG